MPDRPIRTNQDILEYFVCGECGGKLHLITIEDEPEQAYCHRCQRTHTGVLPGVYEIAKEYCDSRFFTYYHGYSKEHNDRLNRGKMCDIIRWLRPRLATLEIGGGDSG